jgi:hypothetical protein
LWAGPARSVCPRPARAGFRPQGTVLTGTDTDVRCGLPAWISGRSPVHPRSTSRKAATLTAASDPGGHVRDVCRRSLSCRYCKVTSGQGDVVGWLRPASMTSSALESTLLRCAGHAGCARRAGPPSRDPYRTACCRRLSTHRARGRGRRGFLRPLRDRGPVVGRDGRRMRARHRGRQADRTGLLHDPNRSCAPRRHAQ